MKKALSLAVLFAGISLATFAQEHKEIDKRLIKKERKHPRMVKKMEKQTPEEIAKLKTERLDKQLKFTDAQRNEVYAVKRSEERRVGKECRALGRAEEGIKRG